MPNRKLPWYYTREQYERFMAAINKPRDKRIFTVIFGSGGRMAELIGETRRRCITCKHFIRKRKKDQEEPEAGIPYCRLFDQALPKPAQLHRCDKHEQRHPGLNIEDVDLESGEAWLLGKGNREGLIALTAKAVEALHEIIGNQTSGKIKWGIGIRRVEQLARHYAGKAGLPDPDRHGRWSPHKMRHTHLTMLVEAARELGETDALVLAKEQARHKSIETTELYLHTGTQTRRKVLDKTGL